MLRLRGNANASELSNDLKTTSSVADHKSGSVRLAIFDAGTKKGSDRFLSKF